MQINYAACGILRAHCYVVELNYQNKNHVLVVDPGGNPEKIEALISSPITHIVLTHAHFDHIGALKQLRQDYPDAKVYAGEFEDISKETIKQVAQEALGQYYQRLGLDEDTFDIQKPIIRLKDGDELLNFKVIHTPGHTKGSICLYNKDEQVLFSGDTLFCNGYGRTDLGGNESDLVQSLGKLMALDSNTTVYPGHNNNTTIGYEKTNLGY